MEEARQITEGLIEAGVDQIGFVQSITQEAHLETHEGLPPTLSREQIEGIVQVAHDHGKRRGRSALPGRRWHAGLWHLWP